MDWLQEDGEQQVQAIELPPWKVAIVDDDEQVHQITELVLKGFKFEGRPLKFLKAYNGEAAMQLFREHNDIALVLLDVVMETEDAGLRVVEFVRDELKNHYTRIILRTGQPGVAPEDQIVRHYDIDGYRAKTEITHQVLTHVFYTALRSYRDLIRMRRYQRGLEAVLNAITRFNELMEFKDFAECLLEQISSVLSAYHTEFMVKPGDVYAVTQDQEERWQLQADQNPSGPSESHQKLAEAAIKQKTSISRPPLHAYYYASSNGTESAFVIQTPEIMDEESERLMELFSRNVVLTMEKLSKSSNTE